MAASLSQVVSSKNETKEAALLFRVLDIVFVISIGPQDHTVDTNTCYMYKFIIERSRGDGPTRELSSILRE